jgi:WD40 repeat protein
MTVSPLSIITAWRLNIKHLGSKKGEVSLQREATLRGHTSEVTCIAASTAWSFVVTGCKVSIVAFRLCTVPQLTLQDGTAAIWDTNRLRHVRTIVTPRKEALKLCAVHECDVSTRTDTMTSV